MAKDFDITLNTLIDLRPAEWAAFFAARAGIPAGPAEAVDTDLSVTQQADKLFRITGPVPAVLHLEFETSGRRVIPDRLLRYNVLARGALELPVHTVVVLLRPAADASTITGSHAVAGADGVPYITFRYAVVRVWEAPADTLLAAGPTIAPLALATDEAAANLPAALDRVAARLRAADVPGNLVKELWAAAFTFAGLRHADEELVELFKGVVMLLEDSSTYQWILRKGKAEGKAEGRAEGKAEGKAEGERTLLLIQGRKKFGEPSAAAAAGLAAITDPAQLERIALRLLDATGWDDLLATP